MAELFKRVLVPARITELQQSAVAEMIGPVRMGQITSVDGEPMFVSLTVGHEGVSGGAISGLGAIVKEWSARVIRRLAELLRPAGRQPAAIYDGIEHYHGNADARIAVGEVVHGRTTEGQHGLQADAIGYVYPGSVREAIRNGERDICSIEADVTYSLTDARRAIVEDVYAACAVVLGHSSRQQPGFAGARVALISEMCPPEEAPEKKEPEKPASKATPDAKTLIEQIKASGVKAADIWPELAQKEEKKSEPERQPEKEADIPAPPADKSKVEGLALDLLDPKQNEFLPADS